MLQKPHASGFFCYKDGKKCMQYESILVFESWTPKQKLLRMKSSGVFKFHSFKLDSFLGAIRLLRDGFLHLGYGLTGDCSPKVPKMGRMTQIPPWPWLLWLFQTPALDAANEHTWTLASVQSTLEGSSEIRPGQFQYSDDLIFCGKSQVFWSCWTCWWCLLRLGCRGNHLVTGKCILIIPYLKQVMWKLRSCRRWIGAISRLGHWSEDSGLVANKKPCQNKRFPTPGFCKCDSFQQMLVEKYIKNT